MKRQKLTSKEKECLCILNKKLEDIERAIVKKAQVAESILNAKVLSGEITDYEMSCEIQYYIEGIEDSVVDARILVGLVGGREFLDAEAWLTKEGWNAATPVGFEIIDRVCYIFHDLCDHYGVSLNRVAKITSVWWDFIVTEQVLVEL